MPPAFAWRGVPAAPEPDSVRFAYCMTVSVVLFHVVDHGRPAAS
jgi:hypothetical protein